MKKTYFRTKITSNFLLCIVFTVLYNKTNFAQTPSVEWRNFSWLDHEYKSTDYVDQRYSDYDWWYDHCTGYVDPLNKTGHTGYIGVGVSKYRCAERSDPMASFLTYDESVSNGCIYAEAKLFSGNYDYGNWENPISGNLGLGFNSVGKINPDGTTSFLITMNYDGEYFRVKQLSDANYITVGKSVATRKRTEAPQNGTPLYYNPTSAFPNDFFSSSIFNLTDFTKHNAGHWDVMKFDDNGTCIFNNIYGFYDYNGANTTFTSPNPADQTQLITKTLTSQQLAYDFSGSAWDFIEDNQGNIVVVGDNGDCNDVWENPFSLAYIHTGKPVLLKLDAAGKVIGKKSLGISNFGTQTGIGGTARAISLATIGGIDYYIVGYSQVDYNLPYPWPVKFIIEAYPSTLLGAPLWTKTFQATSSTNVTTAVWSMEVKNSKIFFPLLTNCNNCQYAGNNIADLNFVVLDLNTGNTIANTYLAQAHAFDLKARITPLSNGDFAVVSATQTVPWSSLGCPAPPAYIIGNCTANCTEYWNTDTYVARVDANGTKIWDKSFDSNPQPSCTNDYPTSASSGGGDPKRQECMYGVSEAPDGGIVLSGNASPNVDDNYMAKLYPDCNAQQVYDIGFLSISTTVNWNSSHKVKGTIDIFSGGVLNITGINTIIEFADTKQTGTMTKIRIFGTGRLNINGATLTSVTTCNTSMWDGIEIYGAGNGVAQTIALQPSLNLTSANISNARLAIANGKHIGIDGPAYDASGGWIIAKNSNFLNNYIDVDFLPYAAPIVLGNELNNKSSFTNCTFKADKFLNDPSYIQSLPGIGVRERLISTVHVQLDGVKGVKFIGNTFANDFTAVGGIGYPTNFRGIGISSNNSIFDVYSTCLAQDINGNCTSYGAPNKFENLRYGVFANATNPLKKFSITSANFTNCNSSIYQSGINYSTVNKNNFIVNTTIPQVVGKFNCSVNPQACMTHFYYANNSSGFSHQENNYTVSGSQQVMGTIFNGTGTAANESYRNKFTNCYVGHQSQLTNGSSTSGINGLQIKCNQNLTTKQYDIRQTSGVLGEQGACTGLPISPSNNTFSHFQPTPESDINTFSAGGFKYNYAGTPSGGIQIPFYFTAPQVNAFNCGGGFSQSTSCPSKLTVVGGGDLPGVLIAKLQADAISNRQVANQLNQALIDGASQNLINAIEVGTNAGNLKNLLSQHSPFLSDDVLIAYLKKDQTPPNSHIKEIVTGNSPITFKVMEVINGMSLPNGIRNQIDNAQIGVSAREQREKEVAYYNFEKDLNVNEIVRYYLNDSTTANTYDNIIKWLEWNNTKPSKIDLIFAKTETADFTRAQFLIDSLTTDTSNMKFIPYLQVNKDLAVNGKTWDSLQTDAVTTTIIELIANDSLHPHMGHARAAIAHAFENKKHYEYIEGLSNNPASRLINKSPIESVKKISEDINLTAYPNPFKDELNINYSILDFEGSAQLQLIELATGRLIDSIELTQSFGTKQFNTQHLANGLYVLSLKQSNKPTVNFKVINIK